MLFHEELSGHLLGGMVFYDVMFMGTSSIGEGADLKMSSRLVMSGNMVRDGDILNGT